MRSYIVLGMIVASACVVLANSEDPRLRFGNGFHMGFGKRAPNYDFKGFHMGFGKRGSKDYEAMAQRFGGFHMGFKRFSIDPMDSEEYEKRYDANHFHMGFGKRGDAKNRFLNNFHMGFGKRDVETVDY